MSKTKVFLIGLIALHLILLFKLVFFPYPELFIYPYLVKIGLLPYAQILDQHFAGVMFFPVNLASIDIDTPDQMRVILFGIVAINHLLLYHIGNKQLELKYPLAANLLYLIWQPFLEGYTLWIDSFVSTVLLLASIFLLKSKNNLKFAAISGFFLGLAILFKQVAIPLAGFVGLVQLLKYKDINKTLVFGIFTSLPVLAMFIHFAKLGVLADLWYWTVTFNMTTFAQTARKYATLRESLIFGYIFLPAILYSLYKLIKEKSQFAALALGSFIFAYARFDYIHLQPALPLAMVVLGIIASRIPQKLVSSVLLIYMLASAFIIMRFFSTHVSNRVYFFGKLEKSLVQQVERYADPGESVFAMGTTPHIYQLTQTRPAGNIFVFQFPWFMIEAQDRVLEGLVLDPPKVVLRDKMATTSGINLVSYMLKIDEYVNKRYEIVDNIDGVEVLIPITDENRN